MSNYTMNAYEMKRDLIVFSKKISEGLTKPEQKFIMDMMFGIASTGTTLISEISRSLKENIKLGNTIERLCDNLLRFDKEQTIMNNYYKEVKKELSKEPIVLFDDSDITKIYGKKFEDIDKVIDGSSEKKEIKPGYHVCEATLVGKQMSQPISLYSKIYSSKSKDFKSEKNYTKESIEKIRKIVGKFTGVFDRAYELTEEGLINITARTIRNYIYDGNVFDLTEEDMIYNKKHKSKNKNKRIAKHTLPERSIENRPKEANERSEYGHC